MFDLSYFNKNHNSESIFIAGVDEVGRGPLAGPVVSACVLLNQIEKNTEELIEFLNTLEVFGVGDSKKINPAKRKKIIEQFSFDLIENQEVSIKISNNMVLKYFIKEISVVEIDEINILNASLKAMKQAFEGISSHQGILLVDGNKKFETNENVIIETVIGGDSKSLIIGLASIIAKEYRDQLMSKFSKIYPVYSWELNSGYGTTKHLEAIKCFGITPIHRKTFRGVKEYCE